VVASSQLWGVKMISARSELKNIVKKLKDSGMLDAVAIIRRDGILLASNFPPHIMKKEVFGMMSATIIGAAKNITEKSEMGKPTKIMIETNEGTLIFSGAGLKALLVCLLKEKKYSPELFKALEDASLKVENLL